MSNVENKLYAILIILEKSTVPWNKHVKELVRIAFEHEHPLLNIIKEKVKLEPILIILSKKEYNLHQFRYKKEHVSVRVLCFCFSTL